MLRGPLVTGHPQSTFPSSEMMHISSTLLAVLLHPLHVIGDSSDWDHIPQESPTNESLILTGYYEAINYCWGFIHLGSSMAI